jgi:hypothetical protein
VSGVRVPPPASNEHGARATFRSRREAEIGQGGTKVAPSGAPGLVVSDERRYGEPMDLIGLIVVTYLGIWGGVSLLGLPWVLLEMKRPSTAMAIPDLQLTRRREWLWIPFAKGLILVIGVGGFVMMGVFAYAVANLVFGSLAVSIIAVVLAYAAFAFFVWADS